MGLTNCVGQFGGCPKLLRAVWRVGTSEHGSGVRHTTVSTSPVRRSAPQQWRLAGCVSTRRHGGQSLGDVAYPGGFGSVARETCRVRAEPSALASLPREQVVEGSTVSLTVGRRTRERRKGSMAGSRRTRPFHCTRIRCPSRISRVACSTPTTAGKPYSRAITAPWVIRPPTSVTRPVIATNEGDQLGSV